uniref:Beta/alpha-defensin C-terminal domain-containing protein n=1 Tax=Theropithecus gelada TaxID=9565 RepID=A0A8D2FLD4_THEGE
KSAYLRLQKHLFRLGRKKSGLGAAEGHCLNLSGVCRRDVCKVVEDQIGACRRRMKCCRAWWILMPILTPLIMLDYQEPLKPKLK